MLAEKKKSGAGTAIIGESLRRHREGLQRRNILFGNN